MNKIKIVKNKPSVKENTPVSVGLNMDQTDAVYKVLEDNFGEEHMKDMFTLGSLSFYNMMVKGGIAGVFNEGTINEESYTVAGKSVTLNKGQKSDGTDWTVTFQNGKETSLSDVLSLIKPFPKGITKENLNEDKAAATRWFGNLKSFYLKAFRELKGEDQATYKTLIKNWANGLSDNKVGVNEQPDVLNKIADMFDRKYPHLKFDVRTDIDRIDVRGSQQDLFNFGDKLHGEKIFDYEVFHIDDEDRGEIVRIIKSDRINEAVVDYDFSESELIEVLRQLKRRAGTEVNMIRAFTKALGRELSDDEIRGYKIDPNLVAKVSMEEEKPGLWANIRAKQERGEKPARKGSKAYKIAKKAGDEINKEK